MTKYRRDNKGIYVKLTPEEKELFVKVAKYYRTSVADIVRISVMEFIKNHGLEKLLS